MHNVSNPTAPSNDTVEAARLAHGLFAQRRSKAQAAFESIGLDDSQIEAYLRLVADHAGELARAIVTKAIAQAAHDVTTNYPCGSLTSLAMDEICVATQRGLVSAVSAYHEWNVDDTISLCVALLEDVNAHTEAKQLHEIAEQVDREVIS